MKEFDGSNYNELYPKTTLNQISNIEGRILPIVSSGDNGKVLKVANGVWIADTIPTYIDLS